jgi:hypothetical protein
MMGVGKTTLDRLIAEQLVDAVKCGKRLLILVASIERYLGSLPKAKLKLPKHLRGKQKKPSD